MLLIVVVEALVMGGRAGVTPLGRALRSRARRKHSIKRVDRLLSSSLARLDAPEILGGLIKRLVGGVRRPVVLIDWTGIGHGLFALVAALPVRGRAVPILFEVHPERRYGSRRVQHRFLERLRDLLPAEATPIVVADAGFQAPFYQFVDEMGWGFVVRVRGGKRRFYDRQITMPELLGRAASVALDLQERPLASITFTPRVILGPATGSRRRAPSARGDEHRRSAEEPWLLATNLWRHTPREVMAIYAQRMKIEEALRDAKSHRYGWGLEYVRSRSCQRLELLLLVCALATFAVILVGFAGETRGLARNYQANTIRSRRVLSLATLGRYLMRDEFVWVDKRDCDRALCELRTDLRRFAPQRANGSWAEAVRRRGWIF
jgi:hypothetical protein